MTTAVAIAVGLGGHPGPLRPSSPAFAGSGIRIWYLVSAIPPDLPEELASSIPLSSPRLGLTAVDAHAHSF